METYVIVRIHGLLQHLLGAEDYEDLIDGKGLWEFPEYSHVESDDDVTTVLAKIDQVLVKRLEFLSKLESGYRGFVRAFSDRLELGNVKIKLRELYGARERYDIYAQYSHFVSLEELLGVEEESEFWGLLEETPYHSVLSTKSLLGKSLEFKEAYLDSCYYAYLKESLHRHERRILRELMDLESLVPASYWTIVLGEHVMKTCMKDGIFKGFETGLMKAGEFSLRALLEKLGISWDYAKKLIDEGQISLLMNEALKNHLKRAAAEAGRRQLSPVYVYYYLLLAKYERDNLQRIVIGRSLELDREKIRQALILL